MKSFKIGDKQVGGGAPVYIVFEAGQTHTGFENALELIDAAAESGADAVKFQVYDTERLISSREIMDVYGVVSKDSPDGMEIVTEPIMDSLKRHEMTREQWALLKRHADDRDITFFTTVCFTDEVDMLASLGVHVFKVSSGDVNHHPFIRYVARKGLPIMLDTGSSTIGDVEAAVDVVRDEGNEQIVIHHCPGGYPARLESVNLRVIPTLKTMFDYPIAFSDHSPGWDMDIAAVALGAEMVEKTIASDRSYREPEHIMSVEVGEAKAFVQSIRDLEIALGKPRREMDSSEWMSKQEKRRSIFAARDLAPGDTITEADLDYRRPGSGIIPGFQELVVGRKAARWVKGGEMIQWEDLG